MLLVVNLLKQETERGSEKYTEQIGFRRNHIYALNCEFDPYS